MYVSALSRRYPDMTSKQQLNRATPLISSVSISGLPFLAVGYATPQHGSFRAEISASSLLMSIDKWLLMINSWSTMSHPPSTDPVDLFNRSIAFATGVVSYHELIGFYTGDKQNPWHCQGMTRDSWPTNVHLQMLWTPATHVQVVVGYQISQC